MRAQRLVIVIDLEHDRVALRVEDAEIVLLVRVVGVMKVVEHRDGLYNAVDGFRPERGHAGRDNREAGTQVLSQLVVQGLDLVGRHRLSLEKWSRLRRFGARARLRRCLATTTRSAGEW